jgi:hypothetical protein
VEGNNELLRMELTELNTFTRHHFQLFLSWYTFFLTVNFVVIGWFTNDLLTGALKSSLPIIIIATFFLVQLIFSYIATLRLLKYFEITHNRCNELLNLLSTQPIKLCLEAKTAIPLQLYIKIFGLMCSTIISFGLFWIALTVYSVYLVPL